jgi:hypothetical protein
VDDDGVTGLQAQVLPLQRLLEVLYRDLIGIRKVSTPFSAATSINTPRVISAPTFSMPSLLKPRVH